MRDVDALVKVVQRIELILSDHIEQPRSITDAEETVERIVTVMDQYDAIRAAERIEAGYGQFRVVSGGGGEQ
jgi:hypothetical protein